MGKTKCQNIEYDNFELIRISEKPSLNNSIKLNFENI